MANHYPIKVEAIPKLIQEARDAIFVTRLHKSIIEIIFETLQQFNGKQINKRIGTALKKQLDDKFVVTMSEDRRNLYVWGGEIKYDQRVYVFLGYPDAGDSFDYQKFVAHNGQYLSNCDKLIDDYKYGIDNAERIVTEYNEALAAFEKAEKALRKLKV